MRSRYAALFSVIVVIAFVWLVPAQVAGQQDGRSYTAPKTSWGDPDLQGVWNNNTVVPLQRPDAVAERETLTEEEVAQRKQANSDQFFSNREGDTGFYNEFWFEYGQDTNRTALITSPASGKLPDMTPEAKQAQAAIFATRMRGMQAPEAYTDLSVYERCITRGLPGAMMPGFYNHNYHIMQTPDHVVLTVEMIHDARIIPIDGRPHLSSGVRQWLGDSRGHWEDDTLVVETTNFNNKVTEMGLFVATVFSTGENLRLVERFTRVDGDTIDYRFTVEDPTTFTDAWSAAIPLNRFDGTLFEYACHEGNYALPNILSGARANDGTTNP